MGYQPIEQPIEKATFPLVNCSYKDLQEFGKLIIGSRVQSILPLGKEYMAMSGHETNIKFLMLSDT